MKGRCDGVEGDEEKNSFAVNDLPVSPGKLIFRGHEDLFFFGEKGGD